MIWREFLDPYRGSPYPLFEEAFVTEWGAKEWLPNDEDRKAAAKLHTQIISRITTQRLGYLDGDEKTALDSVYVLFAETRKLCETHFDGRHFEVLAWHVLNTYVRPFTAKWHIQSKRGMLSALDSTDEFRAELEELQERLRRFEVMLASLRDKTLEPGRPAAASGAATREAIAQEMNGAVSAGIPEIQGGVDTKYVSQIRKINNAEREAIEARRNAYAEFYPNPKQAQATALALSGGGIRSATFSLGVLVALARRGLMPQFDYLSTVSGGGYLGSFLTAFLNSPPPPSEPPAATGGGDEKKEEEEKTDEASASPQIGLRPDDLPFRSKGGEAAALRHIRHHSKYLASGSLVDRFRMIAAQLFGMMLNGLGVVFLAALVALVEFYIRKIQWLEAAWSGIILFLAALFIVWVIIALVLIRHGKARQRVADTGLVILGAGLIFCFLWIGLGSLHKWVEDLPEARFSALSEEQLLAVLGAIPVIASALAGFAGKIFARLKMVLGLLSAFAAPLFFFGVYLFLYKHADEIWLPLFTLLGALVYAFVLNINFTSPHRHYRQKLAEAYLIQPAKPGEPFKEAVELKLSEAGAKTHRGPYHLINAALNVPGSDNLAMQGRLTDFFLFSPKFCGSPLTGYAATTDWEAKDSHLDLGTAMAISGAAAAPQMGLGTRKRLTFWLALLNIRLGYWVRDPSKTSSIYGGAPGISFLIKEMRGSMDETKPWLYLSDGGHIENLGVYELLRRRCKYIVAVDGEQDERMTFGALTTLQRLAAIDLGVKIDINLDDLRLNEQGLSRSHFRFCRIEYPGPQYGYLLYVKLSLTGNEGEFLRRYRLDEPAFPHHSTADQFFSEAQFEAYRALGEHVGEKLFLRALVGEDLAHAPSKKVPSIPIEEWFHELGQRLLEPLRRR